jgi:tRNA pseudouridine38-40 synthase
MRFKLTIEYIGTRYHGWQSQPQVATVQGEILRAVHQATGVSDIKLEGSGRTDSGVHALGQVAHLDIRTTLLPETIRQRLNSALPDDINVLTVQEAHVRFDARRDAVARSYVYQVSSREPPAHVKPFVRWVKLALDLDRLREIANHFVGLHDFQSFSEDDPTETRTKARVTGFNIHAHEDFILLHIEGDHFLWKMVRRLVGVVVEVGCGRLQGEEATELLRHPSNQTASRAAKVTASAKGLFLHRVYYEGDIPEPLPRPPVTISTKPPKIL